MPGFLNLNNDRPQLYREGIGIDRHRRPERHTALPCPSQRRRTVGVAELPATSGSSRVLAAGVNPSSDMNRPNSSSCLLATDSQGDCCT